jgi:uncharacterized protein YuzE
MLTIGRDNQADAVFIEFESGTAGYAEQLDDDRIVDYSANPGRPIGVSLHNVSQGVLLEGLPESDLVEQLLRGLGVTVR